MTILQAAKEAVENFSAFCNHITIVPALKALLDSPDLQLDGFLGPGHVSTVIGTRPYEFVPRQYGKPLNSLVREMIDETKRISALDGLHCLRDPTRGGVATTLNEIALSSEVCIEIHEDQIPVREEVKGACEILGLDPLYVANEGRLVAVVSAQIAEPLVARMRENQYVRENQYGRDARIIGEVKAEPQGIVAMRTGFGGTRIVDMLVGEQLPRIC
jgi:hydrogenase expression/formation protein HypE